MKTDDDVDAMEVEQKVVKDEPATLTQDVIIKTSVESIRNGSFRCNVKNYKYLLQSKGALKGKKQGVKRHLSNHLAVASFFCGVCPAAFKDKHALQIHKHKLHNKLKKCSECPYTNSSAQHLARHVGIMHTNCLSFKCLMPNCDKESSSKSHRNDHVLCSCIRPDWLMCGVCKIRIFSRGTWNSHWSKAGHLENEWLLRRKGVKPPTKPPFDFSAEVKNAIADPVLYKQQHSPIGLLGSPSPPPFSIKGRLEEIEPFRGFMPYTGGLPKGALCCSQTDVSQTGQCRNGSTHNMLCGPRNHVDIPVTCKTSDPSPIVCQFSVQLTVRQRFSLTF